MGGRAPENLLLYRGADDPAGEREKNANLPRHSSNIYEDLRENITYIKTLPTDAEKSTQPSREDEGETEDSTTFYWTCYDVAEKQPEVSAVQKTVLQEDDNSHVLRLLLQQRDLEIQGLRRAAQRHPSTRLSFILQELLNKRQRENARCKRCQTEEKQKDHLQNELDRLNFELEAQKELHQKDIQIMEEKLSKLELAVQYLHKEIKRVEKFQPEGADKTRLAPKETEIIVSVEEGPYLHQETYELWSEMGNCNIVEESSTMTLRRIPKRMSFLDSTVKDPDAEVEELGEDNGKSQEPEDVQTELSLHVPSEKEMEDRWKNSDISLSSNHPESLTVRSESILKSESMGNTSPRRSGITVSFLNLPEAEQKLQPQPSLSLDKKKDQPKAMSSLTSLMELLGRESAILASNLSTSSCFGEKCLSSSFLKIISVDPKGRFIRILNSSSDQDVDMSGYILQQWIGGFPVSIYRFPTNTVLPARHHITIQDARTNSIHKGHAGKKPRAQQFFQWGPECTTILSNAKGHNLSWYSALHRLTAAAQAYNDNVDLSVDKFPLSEEHEEQRKPLLQKDNPSAPRMPHKSTKGVQLKTKNQKLFPIGSSTSSIQGDHPQGRRKKAMMQSTESIQPMVYFSPRKVPSVSGLQEISGYYDSHGVTHRTEECSV
ncbi:lamin tail domain-containing protein 2 isoform B [Alligator mississippiensis]|uniref:Lamin tail domain-containing protein 2 isoform B n=1 Tax=Alligator mississippiensis TaxID=8496 RepID=A0A151NXM5_ALLMI|nr:lamin tail domain-containing protein 2 isoform B [Alligator mississippiensis]